MATKAPTKPTKPAQTAAPEASKAPQTAPQPPAATGLATVAQNGPQAVALPTDFMAELRASAQQAAAKERPSVSKISLKSGQISYMGDPVKGNNMDVIILTSVFRNVYYSGRYDANNVVNPNCFALQEEEEDMAPHENVAEPEHATCEGCPRAEWGSDPGGGRGKACKQSRRLILLPADAVDSAETVTKAEMALLDVPVTSIKNWANLVNTMGASGHPVWGTVVNISTAPDAKTQFKLHFAPLKKVMDEDILRSLMKKRDEALRVALAPWDETQTAEAAEAAKSAPSKGNKKF